MKNVMLIIGFMLSMMSTKADNTLNTKENNRYDQDPIVFNERGIQFYVFMDGQFDFNTVPSFGDATYYRKHNSRKRQRNHYRSQSRGVRIEHDHLGRVRRIGNVFMNYDRFGRIKRIGSVYMRYRQGYLTRIGGLSIGYNRFFEIVSMHGYIKPNYTGYQNYYGNEGIGYTYYGSTSHFDPSSDYYRRNRSNRRTNRTRSR